MKDVALLSEVHPRWAYFNPLIQAAQWFGLFSVSELEELKRRGNLPYSEAIRLIQERCRERGMSLVVRDWTHVDFVPGPYPVGTSYQLSQYQALGKDFDIRHVAITRHPLDSYLSIIRLPEYRGRLSPAVYFAGYRRYAEHARKTGYIRYEDFCAEPEITMQRICDALGIRYDGTFIDRFGDYSTITGESYQPNGKLTLTGEAVGSRTSGQIKLPVPREIPAGLSRELKENRDYHESLELLLYEDRS